MIEERVGFDGSSVPVVANGWTDMEKRVAMQEAITGQHQNVIKVSRRIELYARSVLTRSKSRTSSPS